MALIIVKSLRLFQKSRNGEHEGFGSDIIVYLKDDIISVPILVPVWDIYEAAVKHEQLLFLTSNESPQTVEITALHKWRLKIFHHVNNDFGFYAEFPDQALSNAGKTLSFIVKPYSGADKQTLFGMTSYVRNMLQDLNSTVNAAAVNLIPGLSPVLVELERVNSRIDSLSAARDQALAQLELLGKRIDIRADVDKALFNLVEAINSAYNVNELGAKDPAVSEPLSRAALKLHGFISHMEKMLARRGHKHSSSSTPASPSDPNSPTQNPNTTLPPAPNTPPQNPDTGTPNINPDYLNPPAVGEH